MPAVLRGRDAAAPSMINGRLALRIISAARSSEARCATGISIGCCGTIATSSASFARDVLRQFQQDRTRSLFHGDPEGIANDRRNTARADDLEESLVSGLKALTTSTIWNFACRLLMMPF
jgi:hypothetical protein